MVKDSAGNISRVRKDDPKYKNGELIFYRTGMKHKKETLNKMSKNNAMNNPEYRNKISKANGGTKGLWLNGIKKMAKPDTEKWNYLISEGFKPAEDV